MVMWLPGVWIADVIKLLHILAPVSTGQKKKGGKWGMEGRNEWSKFKLLISFSGRRVPGLLSVCASVLFSNLRPITYSTPHPQNDLIKSFALSPLQSWGKFYSTDVFSIKILYTWLPRAKTPLDIYQILTVYNPKWKAVSIIINKWKKKKNSEISPIVYIFHTFPMFV